MEKGGEVEKGAACCRAVAVYSLHTMTNLYPDELECDKNAGPGRAAGTEVRREDGVGLLRSAPSRAATNNWTFQSEDAQLEANTWKTEEKTLP